MKTLLVVLCTVGALIAAGRPDRYAVILKDAPVAQQLRADKREKQAVADLRSAVLAKQAVVRTAATEAGARVTGANQLLVNAIFVQGTPAQAAQLRQNPGVALVEKLQPIKMHLNRALDLTAVRTAWSTVGGEQSAGAGVKIAIIDTGIDQTHPAFQENGLQYPAGFPKCEESRGECAFVNRKVIAARAYVDMLVGTDPVTSRPDDTSPRDRVGHGTGIAMVAAGGRATGPVGTITGVAPRAWLGNYKVFGSPGVNGQYTYDDVLIQALEDAYSDGMDIAVFSLGAPAVWGPRDQGTTCQESGSTPCDWRASAIEAAAQRGLTIVASAGNDGDFATQYPAYNSVETPGTAPSAITVGATTNSHILYQSVQFPGSNKFPALFGDGPRPETPLTAPLRDVPTSTVTGACSALPDGSLNGAIALIERGDCAPLTKIQNAQRAGATGVIIYQQQGFQGVFRMTGLEESSIPAVLVGNDSGVALKNYTSRTPNGPVTLDPAINEVITNEFDTMAFVSSRGPSTRENAIKPELVAVGTDMYTATQRFDPNGDLYDPTGYTVGHGTSFAAGMVAGAAALIKQRNPQWTSAQIKSALVNTATTLIRDYTDNGLIQASVLDIGAGKLNAADAVRANVTIEPATLSLGVVGSSNPSQSLTIRNTSNSPVSLTLQVRASFGGNAAPTLDKTRFDIPGGGSTMVTARLEGSRPAAGVYEGVINISGASVELHVPYLFLVGDGIPFNVLPLRGDGAEGEVKQLVSLVYKVVDQYGVPVRDVRTQTRVISGGGSVDAEGGSTDDLGIGYADVIFGQVGDQEFYAAVGDQPNFGVYFTGRARAVPVIASGGVVNLPSGEVGQGIAPGSYISIYGQSLSEVTRLNTQSVLPLSLAGVSASFDVPGQGRSFPGRVYYASDSQINVQVPWELTGAESAIVKVTIGDTVSDVVTIPLKSHSPAVFSYNESSGRTLAAVLDSGYGLVGSSNPAKHNDVVQIFVNGLGPVDNQPASGEPSPAEPLARTRVVPEVTIGSQRADVLFSGMTPGTVGLYQVNARIPANAPSGPQPVVVTINGIASKPVSIPVE